MKELRASGEGPFMPQHLDRPRSGVASGWVEWRWRRHTAKSIHPSLPEDGVWGVAQQHKVPTNRQPKCPPPVVEGGTFRRLRCGTFNRRIRNIFSRLHKEVAVLLCARSAVLLRAF